MERAAIGDGVTSIGDRAFIYCNKLTRIEIPGSVVKIGAEAFSVCSALSSLELFDGLASIGESAFDKTLESATIPKDCECGALAFPTCCKITTV